MIAPVLSFDCQHRLAESSELIMAGCAVLAVLCCWCMWEQSSSLCAWARCDDCWYWLKTRYLSLPSGRASWDDCCLWGCALPLHWFVRLNGGEVWWLIIYNTPLPLHWRRLQFFYLQNNSLWSMGNTQHHLMK